MFTPSGRAVHTAYIVDPEYIGTPGPWVASSASQRSPAARQLPPLPGPVTRTRSSKRTCRLHLLRTGVGQLRRRLSDQSGGTGPTDKSENRLPGHPLRGVASSYAPTG